MSEGALWTKWNVPITSNIEIEKCVSFTLASQVYDALFSQMMK